MKQLPKKWLELLKEEINKEYYKNLENKIDNDIKNGKIIYPKQEEIFKAFELTPYENIKIVIIGQDPYPGKDEAEGLAFSVKEGIKIPPSLKNIFKELNSDLGYEIPTSGSLYKWAKQGVFLINTILTVEEGKPLSHKNYGWEQFTDHVIELIDQKASDVVFILWGNNAKSKKKLIKNNIDNIIESSHPSPLGARVSFFGSRPFSKANEILIRKKINPVDFNLN